LAERPLHTVCIAGFIRDNGLESPLNRGRFYACRNSEGLLEGVALIGHATLIEARTTRAMKERNGFGQRPSLRLSNSILTCIEFKTGKVMWQDRSVGKGSITYADGMLYLLGEKQVVGLAEANPKAYVEKGRFPINDRGWDSWAHPVVAGGKLYIRNQNELTCYDVKGN